MSAKGEQATAAAEVVAWRVIDADGRPATDWIDGDGRGREPFVAGGRVELAYSQVERARAPDGLLQLIRDARHRICNDAPNGLGKRPFDDPVYGSLLRRLDAMDVQLAAAPSQPAQAVDVAAIRKVIADLRTWRDEGTDSMARALTRAISRKKIEHE
jgi:hypothetical protein